LLIDERGTLITLTFAERRRLWYFMTWISVLMKWKKTRILY